MRSEGAFRRDEICREDAPAIYPRVSPRNRRRSRSRSRSPARKDRWGHGKFLELQGAYDGNFSFDRLVRSVTALDRTSQWGERELRVLTSVTAELATTHPKRHNVLPSDIIALLRALSFATSGPEPVRVLLKELVSWVRHTSIEYRVKEVSWALRSCWAFSSEHEEVRELLVALHEKLQALLRSKCAHAFSPQEVTLMLAGLHSSSSDHAEVRRLLASICEAAESISTALTAAQVSAGLYGLSSCSSEHAEVRRLLRTLAPLIAGADASDMDPRRGLDNGLYGLKRCSLAHEPVVDVLVALTTLLRRGLPAGSWLEARAISASLGGLRSMSVALDAADSGAASAAVRGLLEALVPHIRACRDAFTARNLCAALYGLQGLPPELPEVRAVLEALVLAAGPAEGLARGEPVEPRVVSIGFYGLQSCRPNYAPVRAVLRTLTALLPFMNGPFEDISVSNALYGFRCCTSDVPEVRAALRALAPLIARAVPTPSAARGNIVGAALHGLQGCSSAHAEVRAVFAALLPLIRERERGSGSPALMELDGWAVSSALYGFQASRADESPELCALLSALAPQIARVPSLDAQGISNGFFGLQGCTSNVPEVRSVLAALTPHLSAADTQRFSAQHVGNILVGLQGVTPDLRDAMIGPVMQRAADLLLPCSGGPCACATDDLRMIAEGVIAALRQSSPGSSRFHGRLEAIYDAVAPVLAARVPAVTSYGTDEARFRAIAARAFEGDSRVSVNGRSSEYLCCFEADIVLRIEPRPLGSAARPPAPPLVLNIEIDGPQHAAVHRQRRDALRDAFLLARGIRVVRWVLSRHGSADAFVSWLRGAISLLCEERWSGEAAGRSDAHL